MKIPKNLSQLTISQVSDFDPRGTQHLGAVALIFASRRDQCSKTRYFRGEIFFLIMTI